ncbi:hypothetical protein EWB00_001657, partial [Schistosoma japonicum]
FGDLEFDKRMELVRQMGCNEISKELLVLVVVFDQSPLQYYYMQVHKYSEK